MSERPETRLVETLPAALDGERIDRVISLLADISRRQAVELLADGRATVNGERPDKPSSRVAAGDEVVIDVPATDSSLQPDPTVAFDIVHVDDQVIVVDKPPDLVVHPGAGVVDATLVNGLLHHHPELAEVGEPDRPGIVHRLDRGTSGLLMVARTELAYHHLVAQLAERTVHRRYLALAEGLVESDEGLIDAPLGRSPGRSGRSMRRAVVADGRPARTRYRVEQRLTGAELTLLSCRLETGRTHQIRIHLAAIGHPVVGDVQYGAKAAGMGRPFLHATELAFVHPTSGETLRFQSDLPDDLTAALERLSSTP